MIENNTMKDLEKNKGGRPAKVLTEKEIIEVEALAAYLNCEQIADYFGIDADTFTAIKKRQEEVCRAYKKGKSKSIVSMAKTLIERANSGDTTAIIFYLKTQAGWSTENKSYIKPNTKTFENKGPIEIIDAALAGLGNGDLTVQEANQIANLANMKANIKVNETIAEHSSTRLSREEILERIASIQKIIDHEETIRS